MTLGLNTLLGDDVPQALVDNSPRLLISERFEKIEGKYDLISCDSCFFNEDRDIEDTTFKLSPVLPIFYYKPAEEKFPILKSRRMGGAPYLGFKLLLDFFSIETSKKLFDLSVGLLTLFFMFLAIRTKFGEQVANISVALASISPIFISNYSYYISEQLLALIFWSIAFFIQRNSLRSRITLFIIFMVGLYVKLTVLVTLVPLFIIFREQFLKNIRFCLIVALSTAIYISSLFLLGDGVSELINRSGEGYAKPLMHLVLFGQEFIALFSNPIVFLNEQMGTLDLKGSYTNEISYVTIVEVGPFVVFFLLCIFFVMKLDILKNVFMACLAWALAAFFVGHTDITYTARFSETNGLVFLIFALVIVQLVKFGGLFSKIVLSALLMMKVYFLVSWVMIHQGGGLQNAEFNLEFNKGIVTYLIEKDIKNPILSNDEREWGILELLSKNKISPIYAQNLDENLTLERIIQSFNSGHILLYMNEFIFLDRSGKNIRSRIIWEDIPKLFSDNKVDYRILKTFKYNNRDVYSLVEFKRQDPLHHLSRDQNTDLLNIKFRNFYR